MKNRLFIKSEIKVYKIMMADIIINYNVKSGLSLPTPIFPLNRWPVWDMNLDRAGQTAC